MQRLASQAQTQEQQNHRNKHNNYYGKRTASMLLGTKNIMGPPLPKKPKFVATTGAAAAAAAVSSVVINGVPGTGSNNNPASATANNDEESFDVFSHGLGSDLMKQKQEYEMRRVWDTWAEQTAWFRSLSEVEQSSGVSSNTILVHYKTNIFPRRQVLLECLRNAVQTNGCGSTTSDGTFNADVAPTNILNETPLASVLLSHVTAASPLLDPSGRQESR